MMKMQEVQSSNIEAIGYDQDHRTLRIQFKSGGSHDYSPVPEEVFEEMKESESVGKFFHARIRKTYEGTKVEQPEPPSKRELYERRNKKAVERGWDDVPFDRLSPEEQAAICERCGVIVDPEMPFNEGDSVLCGGEYCNGGDQEEATDE